jgi:hypothetical protein
MTTEIRDYMEHMTLGLAAAKSTIDIAEADVVDIVTVEAIDIDPVAHPGIALAELLDTWIVAAPLAVPAASDCTVVVVATKYTAASVEAGEPADAVAVAGCMRCMEPGVEVSVLAGQSLAFRLILAKMYD